jgi:hypothetical protein
MLTSTDLRDSKPKSTSPVRILWTPETNTFRGYFTIQEPNWAAVLFSKREVLTNRKVIEGETAALKINSKIRRKIIFKEVKESKKTDNCQARVELSANDLYYRWHQDLVLMMNVERKMDWPQVLSDGCYQYYLVHSGHSSQTDVFYYKITMDNNQMSKLSRLPSKDELVFTLIPGSLAEIIGTFPNECGGGTIDLTPWDFLDDNAGKDPTISALRITGRMLKKNIMVFDKEDQEKEMWLKKMIYAFPEALSLTELSLDKRVQYLTGELLKIYCMVLAMCWTNTTMFLAMNKEIHNFFIKLEAHRYISMRQKMFYVVSQDYEEKITDFDLIFEMKGRGRNEPYFIENMDTYYELLLITRKMDYIMVPVVLVHHNGSSFWHTTPRNH